MSVKFKFLVSLAAFLALISVSLWATTDIDTAPKARPSSPVYEKPPSMPSTEEQIVIHSLTRTREGVKGQFYKLSGFDHSQMSPLLLEDLKFRDHMASIVTIDRMVMESLKARRNVSVLLWDYAQKLFEGREGVEQNIPKAIELCRQTASLGNEEAERNLPIFLNDYAIQFLYGEDGVEKDISKAVELCREAVRLGNEDAKRNVLLFINCYAARLFKGEDGVEKDILKAVELCREAARLGNEEAQKKLPLMIAQAGL